MNPSVDLLDVNVWLALSTSEHPHHALAHSYWRDASAERLAFCRVTVLSFLRLTTHSTGGLAMRLGKGTAAWVPEPSRC